MWRRSRWSSGAVGAVAAALVFGAGSAASAGSLDAKGPESGKPFYEVQDLAVGDEGGFPNYRIPALTVAPNGDLLASYDGRPTAIDAPGPNSILQRRSTDGGRTWGEQTFVREGDTTPPIEGFSDPSYVVDRITGTIFNFHVWSMDQGFFGSQPGTDPADRNVLHANVSVSEDDGHTWEHRTITADITPDPGWRSRFAASGQGIQLRYGEHAGRLIQQFTIIDGDNQMRAVSVYSDDHGETWQAGEPVGVGMDENKTVELSDGRVMLNSRDSARSGYRKVAISEDGGHSYGEVYIDRQLPDPANNASIVRAYPDAPEGSARAQVLLFSNAASSNARTNGTIRMSCDDGHTWPVAKQFAAGPMAYSTLATLPDGSIGLLYEPGHNGIRFARFNLAWLEGVCAPIQADDVELERGDTVEVQLTIDNQARRALTGAELRLDLPEGWDADPVRLERPLLPGRSVTVAVELSVPESQVGGTRSVDAVLTTAAGSSRTSFDVQVAYEPWEVDEVVVMRGEVTNHRPAEGWGEGDRLSFVYRVENRSDNVVTVTPSGNLQGLDPADGAPNCRWRNLPANDGYNCFSAYHIVTADDLDRGSFVPTTSWRVEGPAATYSIEHVGPEVNLP
jgi:sialidase-1